MPQRRRGPRLYLKRAYGKNTTVWIIRDGKKAVSTGCGPSDLEGAARALQEYIALTYQPPRSAHLPSQVLITKVLAVYGRERIPELVRGDVARYSIPHLVGFWGDDYLSAIKGRTCRDYVAWRTAKGVSDQTARRDLETLRATIRYYSKEYELDGIPIVSLPRKAEARQRWLTRSEAASLLRAARRSHVARFVLIGLYTGTRSAAILGLSWLPSTRSGWIDVDNGVLYRRGDGAQTKKRAPPAPIPERLLPFLRRWRQADLDRGVHHVVHYQGEAINKLRRSWTSACVGAGLVVWRKASGGKIDGASCSFIRPELTATPHVLRHTAATWLMQRGVPAWEAAGYLGMTVETLERTYGHHHPDHMARARDAFRRTVSEQFRGNGK